MSSLNCRPVGLMNRSWTDTLCHKVNSTCISIKRLGLQNGPLIQCPLTGPLLMPQAVRTPHVIMH